MNWTLSMWVRCKNIIKAFSSLSVFVLRVNKLNLTVCLDITRVCAKYFDWWKITQCFEIQVGHLGWDALKGRTSAFRNILGDVCMWDGYMLIEVSAFIFNIVCTGQCKNLEDKSAQSTARGCHRTNCCPKICGFGILQSAMTFSSHSGEDRSQSDLHQNCKVSCRCLGYQRVSQKAPGSSA